MAAAGLVTLPLSPQAAAEPMNGGWNSIEPGGDSHTLLGRPEFYTFQVEGRRIRDWVADLAAFKEVSDVVCRQCAEAEVVPAGETAAGEP